MMKCKAKGCFKDIYPSELIKCVACKCNFHIKCQNITTAYFLSNNASLKKTWKCMACSNIPLRQRPNTRSQLTSKSPRHQMPPLVQEHLETSADIIKSGSDHNICLSNSPECSTSKLTNVFSDEENFCESFTTPVSPATLLSRSVGEVNVDNRLMIDDLQAEIVDLTSNLLSTQRELDNQLLENAEQNEQIKKLTREITLLTSICQTPAIKDKYTSRKSYKRHSFHQIINFSSTPSKKTESVKHFDEAALKNRILQLEKELHNANSSINQLEDQIRLLKDDIRYKDNPIEIFDEGKESEIINERIIKQKLVIISTNGSKQVLKPVNEIFACEWDYCHLSLPRRCINDVMDVIPGIVNDLSTSDYCVFVIGEDDFHTTKDYLQVVYKMRNTLKKITNTNLIICLPNYICGRPLFNSRVEMFNKLLMLDIESQEYAYWIDPNAELTFDMFSYGSGRPNHSGMSEIFKAIKLFMTEIDAGFDKNKGTLTTTSDTNDINSIERPKVDEFFRV